MTSPTNALTISLVVLLVAAGACHRQRTEERPRPAALAVAHPLALAEPGGTAPADRAVAEAQERLHGEPGSPQAWVRLGHAWVRKARESSNPAFYRGAAESADAALELAPGERRATALRGLVLLDAHRFEEARQLAAGMLERDPRDLEALGISSDALLELGRFEEAAAAAQLMVDLKPSLPSYSRASHLLWLRGDVEGALEAARLAVGASGEAEPRAWMLVQAGMMLWHRGDLEAADADLDRALAEMPEYAPALAAKGRVALSAGLALGELADRRDFRAAAGWLERAWQRAPLPETAWLLGDARQALGDEPGAQEAYDRVVRDGRADRRTLALFYATKSRQIDEALRLAEAERGTRDDLYTEDAYAWALFRAGRLEDARAAADRATRLGTPDARLLYHAGAIRIAAGEERAGRDLVQAALRLNPEFDLTGAAEARRLLAGAKATGRAAAPGAVPSTQTLRGAARLGRQHPGSSVHTARARMAGLGSRTETVR